MAWATVALSLVLAAAPPAVEWITVPSPEGAMRAAVARPRGRGPFPVVVILHGTHGLAQEYVQLAAELARGGVMAVAPCWFAGSTGKGARFVTPIDCTGAPPMPNPSSSPEAMKVVDTLVEAGRALPGADPRRIALFGHSRGGGAALHYALGGGPVQAVVIHSSGYAPGLEDRAAALAVPVLILHGTGDSPADGGTDNTRVERARAFEAALRRAGTDVETLYTEGGGHNSFFTSAKQRRAETGRMTEFFRRTLR